MRSILLTFVIVLVSQLAYADQPQSPQPVPGASERAAALKLVREAYAADYAAVGHRHDGLRLARKLLAEAERAEEPANQFALLAEAKRLTTEAGDVSLALQAIERLAASFQFDGLLTKARCLWTIAKGNSAGETQQAVVERAEKLVEDAVAADRFGLASKLCEFAVVTGRKGRMWDAVKRLVARGREVNELKTRFAEVERALAVLENEVLDPRANLTAGRYYCFVEGDWERGVTMLALGNDPRLKEVARRELGETDSLVQRVGVADGWWEAAEGMPEPQAEQARRRAAWWYRQALVAEPSLSSLVARKARARMAEVGPIADDADSAAAASQGRPAASPDEPEGPLGPGSLLPTGTWVNLLPFVDVEKDRVNGAWYQKGGELETTRTNYPSLCRIPATLRGDYDLRWEFTVTSGNDCLEITLPVGRQQCRVSMAGTFGRDGGIGSVYGKKTPGDKTHVSPCGLKTNKRYVLDIAVRLKDEKASVAVMRDGRPFLWLRGNQCQLSSDSRDYRFPCQVVLRHWQVSVQFHNLAVRRLSGHASILPEDRTLELPFTVGTLYGSKDGGGFFDLCPQDGKLVGLAVHATARVRSVQPIYQAGSKKTGGGIYPSPNSPPTVIVAKPGYAVGGFVVKFDKLCHGFRIVFLRDAGDRLDPDDRYESQWIGGQGGGPEVEITSGGEPIIGLHGTRGGDEVRGIGLLTAPSEDA